MGDGSGWDADWHFSALGSEGGASGPPAAADRPTPPSIGPYVVLAELAQGGMGVLYRALHPTLQRPVAVKVLLGGPAATQRQLDRFKTEAHAAARLRHPGIVRVHDAGLHQGLPYLVMDLVDGEALSVRLRRTGHLPARDAAVLVARLARALAHAHDRHVLHRDVKPSNVLLDATGEPHLTDFGLAKLLDVTRGGGLTRTGELIGTPGFLAPEQAGEPGVEVDERADIYGLGATLYAALTGRPPIEAATLLELVARLKHGTIDPPRAFVAGIDPDLEGICLACLARDPDARYSTAEALALDLERYLLGEAPRGPDRAPLAPRAAGRRTLVVALGLALASASGAAALWVGRRPGSPPTSPSASPSPTLADHLARGEEAARAGDLEGAIACFTSAVVLAPAAAAPRRRRAEALLVEGDAAAALRDAEVAAALAPDDPAVWLVVAEARWARGALRASLEATARSLELDPTVGRAWVARAQLELKLGQPQAALASATRAVELEVEEGSVVRADVRQVLGDHAGAASDLELALSRRPDHGGLWARLGAVRLELEDLAGARSALDRAVELDPSDAEAYSDRAFVRRRQDQLSGAALDVERALALRPDDVDDLLCLGGIRHQLQQLDAALEAYDRALALDPGRGVAWNNRAGVRLAKGDLYGARADYDRVIALEPDNHLLYLHRAAVWERLERWDEAIADCTRALQDPALAAVGLATRSTFRARQGDIEGALADIGGALEAEPGNPSLLLHKASYLVTRGRPADLREAVALADRTERSLPRSAELFFVRGSARHRLGSPGAAADLQRFLELAAPGDRRRAEARSLLASLPGGE